MPPPAAAAAAADSFLLLLLLMDGLWLECVPPAAAAAAAVGDEEGWGTAKAAYQARAWWVVRWHGCGGAAAVSGLRPRVGEGWGS